MNKKTLTIKTLKMSGSKGFALLAGVNRPIIPQQVTKLASSIDMMGIVRPVVVSTFDFIDGNKTTYIIDGQHLYHALMRMGWDVPYVEIDIKDNVSLASHLALLNSSSKSWTMKDYILVWSGIKKDYVKLSKYFNTYDIELSQVAEILMNNTCTGNTGGSHVSKLIKKGEFAIDDEKRGVTILNYVTDALKLVKRMDRMSNKMFIASYVNFVNTCDRYDHKQFLANLKLNKDKFKTVTLDPEEYKKLLKSII
jgi:hypothetical protein